MLTRRLLAGALVAAGVGIASGEASALDKVTLRTNWLFYGSHSIFFLGIDKGYYQAGDRPGGQAGQWLLQRLRLVANKDSDFAYGSASTMMNLAAQGAPRGLRGHHRRHRHRRRSW